MGRADTERNRTWARHDTELLRHGAGDEWCGNGTGRDGMVRDGTGRNVMERNETERDVMEQNGTGRNGMGRNRKGGNGTATL